MKIPFFSSKKNEPEMPPKQFEPGMTLQPGETAELHLKLSEDELLELLFQAQRGNNPCLTVEYQDEQGRHYTSSLPITAEQLECILDSHRRAGR